MPVDIVQKLKDVADDKRNISAIKDVVKEELFTDELSKHFTVVPNIKGKKQIVVARPFKHVISKEEGCNNSFITVSNDFIKQEWDPREVRVGIKMCYKEIAESFEQWMWKNGYEAKDLSNTDYLDFIAEFVKKAVARDIYSLVLFGNENIDANVLTDENFVPFYNLIDKGLVPTLQYFKTIPAFSKNFLSIDKNTGADYNAQNDLGESYAKDLFFKLVQQAYNVPENATLLSSDSLFMNYANMFTTKELESERQNIKNGVSTLGVWGKRLESVKTYDITRFEDFNNGTKLHIPHFALFAEKSNLQLGLDKESSLQDLVFEYVGGEDESFYIKGRMMLDFKVPNPTALKAAF
ncbi:hypothetical protein [Tenacibaculum sp. 190524A02b]|uniref:hypothetical protein n=1 Tax=Tenacibaculum vairaonense TaxID=3137860 RepID=UPI0031FA693F